MGVGVGMGGGGACFSILFQSVVSCRLDLEKEVLFQNCEKRRWSYTTDSEDWNFFWASVQSIRQIFNPESGFRLNDNQVFLSCQEHFTLKCTVER
jgi:hypothetical protein